MFVVLAVMMILPKTKVMFLICANRSDVAAEAARVRAEGQAAARATAASAAIAIELEDAKQELQRARRDIVRLTALSGASS